MRKNAQRNEAQRNETRERDGYVPNPSPSNTTWTLDCPSSATSKSASNTHPTSSLLTHSLSFVPPFASLLPSPVSSSLPLRHPSTASLLLRSTGTHAVRLPASYSTSDRPPQLPQVPDNSGRQTLNTASEPYHSLGSRCRLSPSTILIHAPRPRRLWSSGMQSGHIAAAQGSWSVITWYVPHFVAPCSLLTHSLT